MAIPHTPFPLGRTAEFDERSKNFAFGARPSRTDPLPTAPNQVIHRVYGKRLNQRDVGACTGFAGIGARNTAPNHHVGEVSLPDSTGFAVYHRATELDDIPGTWQPDGWGEDTGSSGLAACKAMVEMGIFTKYEWCFGLQHLLLALPSNPVMAGTNWYEGMFSPTGKGLVQISGSIAGGHEWVVRGYSLKYQLFYCLNSWGNKWGIGGEFLMSFPTMDRLLREDGDLKVPIV